MHYIFMSNIGIGECNIVDSFFLYDCFQVVFWEDGDAIGVEGAGEGRGVFAFLYSRDLGCSKSDYFVVFIVAEICIEIMKIPACCSQN